MWIAKELIEAIRKEGHKGEMRWSEIEKQQTNEIQKVDFNLKLDEFTKNRMINMKLFNFQLRNKLFPLEIC